MWTLCIFNNKEFPVIVSDVFSQFLSHCRFARNLSEHTLRAYAYDLKSAEYQFGRSTQIATIQRDELRTYMRHMRESCLLKETTIKRRIACLKVLFNWLVEEAYINSNPFSTLSERIRLPKRLPRALDQGDTQRLRAVILSPDSSHIFDAIAYKVAVLVLLETGIRVGELSSICLADLSFSDQSTTIHGKGNRQRLVYFLSPELNHQLKGYTNQRKTATVQSDKLFITSAGLEITPQRLRLYLKTLSQRAGIDRNVTPHMLRHTCATRWLESGLDIRHVQKLLGHSSISTTEIYTHVSDQSLRHALAKSMQQASS
jgi:site-specific recombinase XerD